MKPISSVIFIFSLLSSLILADISQSQIDKYKEVTIVDELLESHREIILERLLPFYGNKTAKSEEKARIFTYNYKYELIYFEVFKDFSIEDYYKSIIFYQTDIGKKYVLSESNMLQLKSKENIRKHFISITLSREKMELIDLIIEAYNILELKMTYAVRYFEIYNNGLPLEMQKSKLEMEEQIKRYEPAMIKYQKGLSKLIYHQFTEKELRALLSFAESDVGQNENQLRYKAEYLYMESVMKDFMLLIKEFMQKK